MLQKFGIRQSLENFGSAWLRLLFKGWLCSWNRNCADAKGCFAEVCQLSAFELAFERQGKMDNVILWSFDSCLTIEL